MSDVGLPVDVCGGALVVGAWWSVDAPLLRWRAAEAFDDAPCATPVDVAVACASGLMERIDEPAETVDCLPPNVDEAPVFPFAVDDADVDAPEVDFFLLLSLTECRRWISRADWSA